MRYDRHIGLGGAGSIGFGLISGSVRGKRVWLD
jgi:hypothetical protein